MLLPFALALLQTPPGFRPVAHFRQALGVALPIQNWSVSSEGGKLRVETAAAVRSRRHERKTAESTKGSVKVKLESANVSWRPGEGVKVADGWIQGFSEGEFGGGLLWFSEDGKRQQRISEDNTDAVESFPDGVFAIQSLTHFVFWYSRLVRVERGTQGWKSTTVTDLHVAPRGVLRDGNRFVFLTEDFVSTLETDGRQREILRWPSEFKPGSMVRLGNGDLWLGGERTILSLHPKPDGTYREQWYVPSAAK